MERSFEISPLASLGRKKGVAHYVRLKSGDFSKNFLIFSIIPRLFIKEGIKKPGGATPGFLVIICITLTSLVIIMVLFNLVL